MTRCLLAVSLLLLLAGCQNIGYQAPHVQGIVGLNTVGKDHLDYGDLPSGYQGDPDTDMPTAPLFGFAGQQPMIGNGENIEGGFDGGALFSWWRDGVETYGAAGGGTAIVIVDTNTRMWMADFFLGVYGAITLAEKVRLSVGAGPTLAWAGLDYETDLEDALGGRTTVDGWDSDWSWGAYARGGIEYQMDKSNLVGVGVRYTETDFRFSDIDTDFDFSTWQLFLTFSTKF